MSSYVFTLNEKQIQTLQDLLRIQSIPTETSGFIKARFKDQEATCTLYTSSKFLIQGRGADKWLTLNALTLGLSNPNSETPALGKYSQLDSSEPPPNTLSKTSLDKTSLDKTSLDKMSLDSRASFLKNHSMDSAPPHSTLQKRPDESTSDKGTIGWIGADETGKGDYFGPLCLAAAYLSPEGWISLKEQGIAQSITDSKKISDQRIRTLASALREHCIYHEIILMPEQYNRTYTSFNNLNKLMRAAHKSCIEALLQKLSRTSQSPKGVIVDQFAQDAAWLKQIATPFPSLICHQETRAEKYLAVAAASIIARDSFLTSMDTLSAQASKVIPGLTVAKGGGSAADVCAAKLAHKLPPCEMHFYVKWHFANTRRLPH